MKLITYEIRMSHIDGPDLDWWARGDKRIAPERAGEEALRMQLSDKYRNVAVQDDPHDQHTFADIQRSLAGLSEWCTVEGCTWSWDYD